MVIPKLAYSDSDFGIFGGGVVHLKLQSAFDGVFYLLWHRHPIQGASVLVLIQKTEQSK